MSDAWADITPGARKFMTFVWYGGGVIMSPPLYQTTIKFRVIAERLRRYFPTTFSQTWQDYCLVRRYFPAVFVEFRYLVHVES